MHLKNFHKFLQDKKKELEEEIKRLNNTWQGKMTIIGGEAIMIKEAKLSLINELLGKFKEDKNGR